MKSIAISGSPRENVGKRDAKELRYQGLIPAVLYGGATQTHFSVSAADLKPAVYTPEVHFIDLDVAGTKSQAIIKDMQFHPFVLVVPVGAKVSFPNLDPTRHHVYSFSPAKRFELKLFAKDQTRSVVFDKPGVVALGCNIHDGMTAFVMVTDSAWTAKTGPNGIAQFGDAPNAAGRVSVWHPYLRAKANLVEQNVSATSRSTIFTVALRAPPMALSDGY